MNTCPPPIPNDETERDGERKQVCSLSSPSLCWSVRVCTREAAADRRALGDYRAAQGTRTHRAGHRHRQAGWSDAGGSPIGICRRQPTESERSRVWIVERGAAGLPEPEPRRSGSGPAFNNRRRQIADDPAIEANYSISEDVFVEELRKWLTATKWWREGKQVEAWNNEYRRNADGIETRAGGLTSRGGGERRERTSTRERGMETDATQTTGERNGVSQFKVHDYRLVFFWSLVLGVQTPEDGTTGGRSFCDWTSS
ncbi:hypothetical protein EYF80_004354 [Liparis tanakae]|uniref:Uncharacterized protein n=1 Tax=Liparis tanakae TaxID=230148 RepID=A0A4Z2J7B3_9TELE|nr:hypothetical protein EYF80_004354 [Liparis tanakae]